MRAFSAGPAKTNQCGLPGLPARRLWRAPDSVKDVVRSGGKPLDRTTRRTMEPYFGDLSHVRVHADERAAASADSIGAAAYTWKDHVSFAAGRWEPGTRAGQDLLAHELVHVTQQRGASEEAAPEVVGRDHPLEKNARAVLAGNAGPERATRAMLHRQGTDEPLPPVSLGMRPKQRPGLGTPKLGFHLSADDKQTISDLLTVGNLDVGPDLRPMFQGKSMSIDELADAVRPSVLPIIPWGEVRDFVGGAFLRKLVTVKELPPLPSGTFVLPQDDPKRLTTLPPGLAGGGAAESEESEWTGAVGGQWTYHINNRNPRNSGSMQVQFQRGSGAVSEVIQFQVDAVTGQAQPMGGIQVQASKTWKGLNKSLQLAGFVQLLGGLTEAQGSLSGDITFQVQAGLQVTATFGKVSVALQVGLSLTAQDTQKPALDFNLAPQAGGPNRFGAIDTAGGGQAAGFTVRF
jgi:Domain of unknown function (DUF4157)